MNKQFNEYAEIYDELFSAANDYRKEVNFYHKILKKENCKSILEVGCGAGHRGQYFIEKGYDYVGLDISSSMLKIARRKYPQIKFIEGDVRNLKIKGKFDAILFLGKGSVYLISNKDVLSAFNSMKKMVKRRIIVDFFDATKIIPNFKRNISWHKKIGNKIITRKSQNELDLTTGWTWKRKVNYIVKKRNQIKKYKDYAILRAFTDEEIKIFLALVGIDKIKFLRKPDTLISVSYLN